MNAKRLLTVAVVSMLVIGGGATLGAAAPADAANGDGPGDVGNDLPAETGENVSESADEASGAAEERSVGPDDGLPAQAPDHVGEIHDRIDSFLNGSIDDLGDSLGALLGDGSVDENADDTANADGENADADEEPDESGDA